MRPLIRPLAAASAAAYLLAGWLAAALHSHEGHGHAGHSHEAGAHAAACTTCSCGHHHHKPAKAGHEKDAPAEPHGHDGCVVCDFLAQPPLAAPAVSLDEARGPVLPAAEPAAPAFTPAVVLVSRSRGPPVA